MVPSALHVLALFCCISHTFAFLSVPLALVFWIHWTPLSMLLSQHLPLYSSLDLECPFPASCDSHVLNCCICIGSFSVSSIKNSILLHYYSWFFAFFFQTNDTFYSSLFITWPYNWTRVFICVLSICVALAAVPVQQGISNSQWLNEVWLVSSTLWIITFLKSNAYTIFSAHFCLVLLDVTVFLSVFLLSFPWITGSVTGWPSDL